MSNTSVLEAARLATLLDRLSPADHAHLRLPRLRPGQQSRLVQFHRFLLFNHLIVATEYESSFAGSAHCHVSPH
jgi:hypothetical protein